MSWGGERHSPQAAARPARVADIVHHRIAPSWDSFSAQPLGLRIAPWCGRWRSLTQPARLGGPRNPCHVFPPEKQDWSVDKSRIPLCCLQHHCSSVQSCLCRDPAIVSSPSSPLRKLAPMPFLKSSTSRGSPRPPQRVRQRGACAPLTSNAVPTLPFAGLRLQPREGLLGPVCGPHEPRVRAFITALQRTFSEPFLAMAILAKPPAPGRPRGLPSTGGAGCPLQIPILLLLFPLPAPPSPRLN